MKEKRLKGCAIVLLIVVVFFLISLGFFLGKLF